jgi:hypothetical protein
MSIKDCLKAAAEQGELLADEAAELARQFDAHFAAARTRLGDAAAMAEAKAALERELRNAGAEAARRADLTEAARLRLKARFMAEKDFFTAAKSVLSHYGFRNGSSVRGRTEAILSTVHGRLADVMDHFQRTGLLGKRANMATMPDFIRALHGENVGDATAKTLAKAVSDVFEDLRLRFNAAGGAMPKLEGFGLPHSHDPLKVKAMGRAGWKDFIRPLIDPERMIDGLTQEAISPQRLEQALDHAYDQIVSGSTAWMTPTSQPGGMGSIASRRAESRFFVFRNGDAWLKYHSAAGKGDVVQAIFGHFNAMAKDTAAMEMLGPNPAGMVEWMKQVVQREFGQKAAGADARAGAITALKASEGQAAAAYVGWLWQQMRGNGSVVSGAATMTANVKNVVTSAVLGASSILAGLTDPFIASASRKLAGLPTASTIGDMAKMLKGANREQVIRAGVVWDEYVHVAADSLRFAGPALGSDWSRWLADRALTFNGLKPLTDARKLVEARAWQEHIADMARAGVAFDALDARFRRALDGFGVTDADWAIWTKAIDHNGFVTPMEIITRGGEVRYLDSLGVAATPGMRAAEDKALAHRAAAEKLAELVSSWSERSVPTGTPNARAIVSSGVPRGTIPGELVDYVLQLKSFGLSFTAMQIEAVTEMAGRKGGGTGLRSGLGYFAPLCIGLTIGAAAYIQIKAVLDGKDPPSVEDPGFWGNALLTGGGFGLFGDFVKATENRFGQSMIENLVGPGLALLGDSFNLAWQMVADGVGNTREVLGGPEYQAGTPSELRQFAQRWTPVASSHPATRAAFNRVVLDNLQWMTDPKADKKFKAKLGKAKKDGSPYFLPPGSLTPAGRRLPGIRPPDMGNALRAPPR